MFRFISTTIKIECKLDNGDETLHPQAKIYNSAGVLQATVNLTHVISGIYDGTWVGSATLGEYKVDCIVYTNAIHTIPSTDYNEGGEDLFLIESLNDLYDLAVVIDGKIDIIDADITIIDGNIDAIKLKTDTIDWNDIDSLKTWVEFIYHIQGGRWQRDGTQMIFYKADNVTEVVRFDLKDANGNPANEAKNVFERVKV